MYAIEFQARIENGVVHIPKKYKELQQNMKATFVVMYEDSMASKKQTDISDELDLLFSKSNNKIKATMELATNTDEMINDGIL